MSFDQPLPPFNAGDPTATFLSSSCLDFLLIELVPMAYRVTNELEADAAAAEEGQAGGQWGGGSGGGGGGDDHYYAEGGARTVDDEGGNKVGNRSRTNDNDNDDDASSTAAGAGARDGAAVGRSGSVVVAEAARRALDEDEERDAVFYRLETLGYRVGQGLVER